MSNPSELFNFEDFEGIKGVVPWVYDTHQEKFTHIGDEITKILGFAKEDFLKKEKFLYDLVHPLDRFVFTMDDTGEVSDFRFISNTQNVIWFQRIVKQQPNKNIKIGMFIDVTSQKSTEHDSVQEKIWLNLLLKTVNVGVVIQKLNNDIILINQKALDLFDIKEEKTTFQYNKANLFFEKASQMITNSFLFKEMIHLEGDDEFDEDNVIKTSNGLTLQVDYFPVKSNQLTKGHIWMFRDVTSYHTLMNEMEQVNHELQLKNEELNQYTYVVSHDLKAPLRAMGNVIEWIEESVREEVTDKDFLKEEFDLIRSRTKRLESYISGLLQYNRAGNTEIEISEINSHLLVKSVVNNLLSNNSFTITFDETLPVIKSSDILLQQIFTNLISNAMKYNDKGDKGEVHISCRVEPLNYLFIVSDNGPGIPENSREKVFEIFKTLNKEESNYENTGIGLSIVKKIVSKLGGKIWIEGNGQEGCDFIFSVPKT